VRALSISRQPGPIVPLLTSTTTAIMPKLARTPRTSTMMATMPKPASTPTTRMTMASTRKYTEEEYAIVDKYNNGNYTKADVIQDKIWPPEAERQEIAFGMQKETCDARTSRRPGQGGGCNAPFELAQG
jgi:hypothetical protein